MKTIIPTVAFLLAATFSFAGETPTNEEEKCRNAVTNFPVDYNIAERVEWDLLRGIWTLTDTKNATETVFLFNTYGVTDIIETQADGSTDYSNSLWRVESYNGYAFLVLNEQPMSKDLLYRVDVTCKGITLTDVISNERMVLNHQPKKPDYKVNLQKANMIGDWDCVSYPFTAAQQLQSFGTASRMPGAFLKYEFNPNGTYKKSVGNDSEVHVEEGHFEVSKDGKFLIFFAANKGEMEDVVHTTIAHVKYMDTAEMVLEITDYPVEVTKNHQPTLRTVTFIQ